MPMHYFGGVLDQYFQRMTENNYTRQPQVAIGQDGRVGAFDGEFGGVPTGVSRQLFGIELDGVLYENDFYATQENPNSERLLSIPVVDIFPGSNVTTGQGLLPDAGGTSGGHIDYSLSANIPKAQAVISKTPGQRAPGLVGGYLIQQSPWDFESPFTGFTEDDAFTLLLHRPYTPSPQDQWGAPLDKERQGFFDFAEKKRLMSFSADSDRKDPINTASQVLHEFLITTDPPGLPPVRIRAVVDVKEKEGGTPTRLFATTQSDGSEAVQKAFVDAGTDLATEIIGGAILTVASAGGYLETCGGDIIQDLVGEAMDIGADLVNDSFTNDGSLATGVGPVSPDEYGKTWAFAYGALKGGVDTPYLEGTGIQWDAGSVATSLLESAWEKVDKKRKYVGLDRAKIAAIGVKMPLCKIARAPITATKKAIKEFTSIERLGGRGSAEAQGIKSIAIAIPQEAQLPDPESATGTYNYFYNYHRRVEIRPKESFLKPLSDSAHFNYGAEQISDKELVDLLRLGHSDPARYADAQQTLRNMAVGGVVREISETAQQNCRQIITQFGTIPDCDYHGYSLRTAGMNSLRLFIVPGEPLASGNVSGDFALTTDTTTIPVSTLTVGSVTRSNPNATARAFVHFGEVRMVLRNGIILRE